MRLSSLLLLLLLPLLLLLLPLLLLLGTALVLQASETRVACRAAYMEAAESFPDVAQAVVDRLSQGGRAKLLK